MTEYTRLFSRRRKLEHNDRNDDKIEQFSTELYERSKTFRRKESMESVVRTTLLAEHSHDHDEAFLVDEATERPGGLHRAASGASCSTIARRPWRRRPTGRRS